MPLSKQEKVEQVIALKEKLKNAQSVVLVNYGGINVTDDTELRAKCREANVEYKVYKNRLVKRALDELGIDSLISDLKGSTAVAISLEDPIAPARVINEHASKVKVLKFKSGIVDGKALDAEGIKAVANIPSKEVLLAQLLGLLQSGLSAFARAIQAVAEKKAE